VNRTMSPTIEIQDTVQMLLNLADGDHRQVRRSILDQLSNERTQPRSYYNERLDMYYKLLDHLRVVSGI
jgi:hypothetical protein